MTEFLIGIVVGIIIGRITPHVAKALLRWWLE